MTEQKALQQYLLEAIGSVVPMRGGAYVAGPLATGKKYYELLASGQREAASKMRDENQAIMKGFVASLRQRLVYPVIDPGLIKPVEWTNDQIGEFYIKVIELFAKEIWFMDGWEYSRGATKEFQFAISRSLVCLDARGVSISREKGSSMISEVVSHLTRLGIDATRFADRLSAIQRAG